MCAWLDLHVSINPHVFSNVGVYLSVKVRVCLLLNSSTEVYINKNLHCGRVCTVSSVENKTTRLIVLNACCQSSYTLTYIMTTSKGKTKPGILFWWGVSHALNPCLSQWLRHAIMTQNYGTHISSPCPINHTLVAFLSQASSDRHSAAESRLHSTVVAGLINLNIVKIDVGIGIDRYKCKRSTLFDLYLDICIYNT